MSQPDLASETLADVAAALDLLRQASDRLDATEATSVSDYVAFDLHVSADHARRVVCWLEQYLADRVQQ